MRLFSPNLGRLIDEVIGLVKLKMNNVRGESLTLAPQK